MREMKVWEGLRWDENPSDIDDWDDDDDDDEALQAYFSC